jgi:phosphatidylglycerol---prolipoprotein diacylglyceryl transferase
MFPQVLRIGNFFLPTYGLLVALAFLAGLWMTSRLSRRAALPVDAVMNLGIYTAIAGMAGAKLMMILLDLRYYTSNPGEILSLATLQAGGIFYGGLVLALVTAFLYMRRKNLPGLATADVFAPGLALGHAIGRLGCFAAGCCWGVECRLPWAVTFTNPEAHRLVGVPLGIPLHPTQLYEAAGEALIFAVLYRRFHKPHRPGAIIGLYLVLYSAVRFFVEFVRAHDQANPYTGPFVAEQWIALALMALGVFLMRRGRTQAVPVRAARAVKPEPKRVP